MENTTKHGRKKPWQALWGVILCLALLCAIVLPNVGSVWAEQGRVLECHHQHDESCGYGAAIPGAPCTHVCGEGCRALSCALAEHTHSDDCWQLTCGSVEDGHVHESECRTLLCGAGEHTHGEGCYTQQCTHAHDDACGYSEGTPEQPCRHEHTDECYITASLVFIPAPLNVNKTDAMNDLQTIPSFYIPVVEEQETETALFTFTDITQKGQYRINGSYGDLFGFFACDMNGTNVDTTKLILEEDDVKLLQGPSLGAPVTDPLETPPVCTCNPVPGEGEAHQPGCPLYVSPCICNPIPGEGEAHQTGCPLYVPQACICNPVPGEGEPHQPGCPLYVTPACTCAPAPGEGEAHQPGCPLYVAPVPDCTCDPVPGEGGAHQPGCPLYVAPVPACTCDPAPSEGEAHQPECPLYEPACTCDPIPGEGEAHQAGCPLAVDGPLGAPANGISDITLKSFKITESRSGTWDKDADDDPGNDSSTANDKVLSLDKIVYITSYSVATTSGLGTTTGGSYYFEAVLPCGENIASWNTSGMSWLDNAAVTTDENGNQVLSGVLNLENAQSAPRVGSLEWMINVNSTTNGEEIPAPTFTMWVGVEEKPENAVSAAGRKMFVSSKANYNAQIKYEGLDSSGNRQWSLALQLKSSSLEKGMLGISAPNGTLAFDVVLDQNQQLVGYKLNNQTDTGNNVLAADYGKLAPFDDGTATLEQTFNKVYNGGAVTMTQSTGGHVQVKLTGITVPEQFYADYVTHNAGKANKYQGVDYNEDTYNFAAIYFTCTDVAKPAPGHTVTATATIGASTIIFVSTKWQLNDTYANDNTASYTYTTPIPSEAGYSTGPWQGNWVGKIDMNSGDVISYDKSGKTQLNIGDRFRYRIETSYAQCYGTAVGLPVSDKAFVKFSGKAFDVVDDSSYTEYSVSSHCQYNPGSGYVNVDDEKKVTESHVNLQYVTLKTGLNWASESAMLNTRYSTSQFNVYASVAALKASGEVCVGFLLDTTYPSYTYYYAYHNTYYELPVLQVRDAAILDGSGNLLDSSRVNDRVYAQVVDLTDIKIRPQPGSSATGSVDFDADRLSSTFLVNPGAPYTDEYGNGIYQVNVAGGDGLANRKIGYKKTTYATNAQETVAAEHQGNERIHSSLQGCLSGSSIKINTYSTYVNKQIAQRTADGSELNAFKVDRGQRRADFLINAGTTCGAAVQSTDTLTITDVIPAGLYPLDSSITGTAAADIEARWGVSYGGVAVQDSGTNGGAGVTWTDENATNTVAPTMTGTGLWQQMVAATQGWASVPAISYTLTETANTDGATTLVWTITNLPLGYALPTIHYGAQIGTPNDSLADVKNGDALTNKVSVQSAVLPGVNTDESRITVYKVSGGIISKKADKETLTSINDPIGYTIEFSNNSTIIGESERDDMYVADVFHYLGDSSGSTDPGNYVLEDVSFNGRINGYDSSLTLQLYYSLAPGAQVDAFIAGYPRYTDIDFSDPIWEAPITVNVNSSTGRIEDANIKTALEGKKVTSIIFVGRNIPQNSTFAVHYGLAYASEAEKAEVIADMNLSNTATLQVGGNVDQQAQSTSTVTGGVLFRFMKVDGSGNPLPGAQFKLYKLTCADPAHNHDANISDLVRDGCYTALQENGADKIFSSGSNGIVDFDLLQNGTYVLVEVKAPTGCGLPTGQWKLIVDGSADNRISITAIGTVPAFYLGDHGEYRLPNYPQTVMPASGGIGTVLFTAGGAVLIGIAILVLILSGRKKRKPEDKNKSQRYSLRK